MELMIADIVAWRNQNPVSCPNCCVPWDQLHQLANIVPHFDNMCTPEGREEREKKMIAWGGNYEHQGIVPAKKFYLRKFWRWLCG